MKADRPTLMMAAMFVLTSVIALAITPVFVGEGMQAFEDEDDIMMPVCYIGVILLFTAVILILIKRGFRRLFHGIVVFAFFVTICYVLSPFISAVMSPPPEEWKEVRGIEDVVDVEMLDLDGDGRDEMAFLKGDGTLVVRDRWRTLRTFENCSDIASIAAYDSFLAFIQHGQVSFLSWGHGELDPLEVNETGIYANSISKGDIEEGSEELLLLGPNRTIIYTWERPTWWMIPEYPTGFPIKELFLNSTFSMGDLIRDHLVTSDDETLYSFRPSWYSFAELVSAIDISGLEVTQIVGLDHRVLLVNGTKVRMLTAELSLERIWEYEDEVRYVHAEDAWGDDRDEVVVLEGDSVRIRYGKDWRTEWVISDIVSDVSGVDADFGEWDGDDDTVELFVVADDGRVLWVAIHVGGLSAAEEMALLFSPQNIVVAALAAALTGLLLVYPEWYVLDTVGVLVSAGVASLFGISFGLLPAIVLLVGLMAYDAFAVYQSKHMIDLADEAVSQHLPLLLVVPKEEGYSYLRQGSIKGQIDRGEEREAMFLGMGDLIIPTVLVVSAYRWLDPDVTVGVIGGNLAVALATMAGILAGFAVLAVQVARGKPHAGLPFLNSGALAGFIAGSFAVYGSLGL